MKVVLTGATGFVRRHVTTRFLREGRPVVAVARSAERAKTMPWYPEVDFVACALTTDFKPLDCAIFLSWHIADELAPKLRAKGCKGMLVTPLPVPRVL
jgi:nucleoside-diphosphate-sugar epimerase